MHIRIEDQFEDVLGKAAAGWNISADAMAEAAGLAPERVEALLSGGIDDDELRALAPVLKLDADKLIAMARNEWYPDAIHVEGLEAFNTPHPIKGYEEMTVNSFLVWNAKSRDAVVFDAGTRADMMLGFIRQKGLKVQAVFLTHTHGDHVEACADLLTGAGDPLLYAPEDEPFRGAEPVAPGNSFDLAGLTITAHLTNGHSPGGTTYVIDGLSRKVAIVGDSIFCLSQGGAKASHQLALDNNRKVILSLPDSTVLCPGHGPMTTVADEKQRNPFFPGIDS